MRSLLRHRPSSWQQRWQVLMLAVLVPCALAPLGIHRANAGDSGSIATAPREWPQSMDGKMLRPMALSNVEQRFADRFPGRIGRFSTGEEAVTLRAVDRPTRMLHPAADCYRGLGFRVVDSRLEKDAKSRMWRCFTAWRDGQAYRVCERIEAADGRGFTDTSAWFWDAALERSRGPWLAVTRAQRL